MLYLFGDDVMVPTSRFGSPHRHHFHHRQPCHSPRTVPRGWNHLINWGDLAQDNPHNGDKLERDLEHDIGEVFKALGFEVVPEKKPKTDPTKAEEESKETSAVEQDQKEGQQQVISSDTTSKDMFRLNILMGKTFKPEDIKVSLKDRKLTVEAKREQTSEDGTHRYYEEVSRSFTLPEEAELKELKSIFTPNGVLKLEAPVTPKALPEPPKPVQIPITMEE